MIDAYIFDLDGTLLDTEVLWIQAIGLYLRERDPSLTDADVLKLVYGRSWHDIYVDICRRIANLNLSLSAMQAELKPYFHRLRARHDMRIVGSIDLLKRLARTAPVCIVSGSPREEITDGVALMGIAPLLAFYLGAEDYTPGKPDPAGFLKAAGRLGVAPAACLVFEDSAAGTTAARRAGMYCVALSRPNRPPQDVSAAHWVLDDLSTFTVGGFEQRLKDLQAVLEPAQGCRTG